MKRTITIEVEIDTPFANAEQERYVLATIEDALEPDIWFSMLANRDTAPQKMMRANARFTK